MANAHMPQEFLDAIAHHLPPESLVGPKGGRPRVGHATVVRALWFVLTTGCRWEDVPPELGCSDRTAHRRLRAWEEAGIWDRLKIDLLRRLKQAGKLDLDTVIIDGVTLRAFGGGEATGPRPVDRRRKGTKHTLMVNKAGVPLAVRSAGANASDHTQILPIVVLDLPGWGASRGGPRSCRMRRMPTGATTARRPGRSCDGWGSSRTSPRGGPSMAAGWARSGGWWSGRSAG